MSFYGLENSHQSAYRVDHTTRTVLLSIKIEIQNYFSRGRPTSLTQLDFSTVFDTINHNILLYGLSSLCIQKVTA